MSIVTIESISIQSRPSILVPDLAYPEVNLRHSPTEQNSRKRLSSTPLHLILRLNMLVALGDTQ